jgi:hypothetical protein
LASARAGEGKVIPSSVLPCGVPDKVELSYVDLTHRWKWKIEILNN